MKLFNIDWDAVDKEEARLKKKWRKSRNHDIVVAIVTAPIWILALCMLIALIPGT